MASLTDDQPPPRNNYANWFFSLRRKAKKPNKDNTTPNSTPLQHSCIDLSATNSVFYLTAPPNLASLPKDELNGASTDHIYEEDESDEKNKKSCGPCCCPLKTQNRNTPPKYNTLEESSTYVYKRTESTTSTENTVNLRTELMRSTQLTTTRTLVIMRPIEILLNDQGEIIAKRPATNRRLSSRRKARRSNSLGSILDELDIDAGCSVNTGNNDTAAIDTASCALRPGILASCDDLQFIDDNEQQQQQHPTNNSHTNNNNPNNNNCNNNNNKNNTNIVNQAELRNQQAVIMRNNNKV